MAVVVECDKVTIIFINTGCSDDRATKISADVFGDDFRITFIRLGINIESVFVLFVTGSFEFFKGGQEWLRKS